jgi:hypothetical protein
MDEGLEHLFADLIKKERRHGRVHSRGKLELDLKVYQARGVIAWFHRSQIRR